MKKICEKCGKEFECRTKTQRFCSRSCAPRSKTMSEEARKKLSEKVTYNLLHNEELRNKMREKVWNNKDRQNESSSRMKTNNPMYKEEYKNKMINTLHTTQKNHFNNCGNGHISYVESLLLEDLRLLGFEYNKAINTKLAREKFPNNRYPNHYKPDFVNENIKLCIEIDGTNHRKPKDVVRDKKKELCLEYLGYKTVRFTNEEVINSYTSVINSIKEVVDSYGKTN